MYFIVWLRKQQSKGKRERLPFVLTSTMRKDAENEKLKDKEEPELLKAKCKKQKEWREIKQ